MCSASSGKSVVGETGSYCGVIPRASTASIVLAGCEVVGVLPDGAWATALALVEREVNRVTRIMKRNLCAMCSSFVCISRDIVDEPFRPDAARSGKQAPDDPPHHDQSV